MKKTLKILFWLKIKNVSQKVMLLTTYNDNARKNYLNVRK